MKRRILIVNPSGEMARAITEHKSASGFAFAVAASGKECLAKIARFRPDLILIDLLLPEMHGIEVLKKLKANKKSSKIGVIIASAEGMIQNYQAAIHAGADYFLNKPFKTEFFFTLAKRFFSGRLKPDPFASQERISLEGQTCYLPKQYPPRSYVRFWGTRGSSPVAGPEYVRYGGNTCCLEVASGDDRIIIDAGTGIRPLGKKLLEEGVRKIHLFLGHTHWDHIIGLPFFAPLYEPKCDITIWSPVGFEKSTEGLFNEMLAYSYFPVRLEEIQAKISFKDLHPGKAVPIGKISVDSHYTYHPGATVGFKIKAGGQTFGYVTDNEVLMGFHGDPHEIKRSDPRLVAHQSFMEFFKRCDFLIHEAQFTSAEYQERVGWGHSSVSNVAVLIKYMKIKDWFATHHDPSHTDNDLQRKLQLHYDTLQDLGIKCGVHMAYDGYLLPL